MKASTQDIDSHQQGKARHSARWVAVFAAEWVMFRPEANLSDRYCDDFPPVFHILEHSCLTFVLPSPVILIRTRLQFGFRRSLISSFHSSKDNSALHHAAAIGQPHCPLSLSSLTAPRPFTLKHELQRDQSAPRH